MFVVDTNILVYAADSASPEHERCKALVQAWRRQSLPWYLTWGIVYEFLRVTTHPRVFRNPWTIGESWAFVDSLYSSRSLGLLTPTTRHSDVARMTWAEIPDVRGNLVHDAHTAVLMRENGVRQIYTRDTDFHRFPFLEVVDPLTGEPHV